MKPSHVLVAFDGSPLAERALKHAVDVYSCKVTVLNVVLPVDSSMSESGVIDEEERRVRDARERVESVVGGAVPAEEEDVEIEVAVEHGDPAGAILGYLEEHDVDHVVMGGHGGERGQLTKRLLGATSMVVVGEAPVSVTVVR